MCGQAVQERSLLLEQLMEQYGKKVLKLAYYHVRNRSDAEDILQEVFLRAYRGLPTFRGESSYYTWLYRITINLCRDYMQKNRWGRILPYQEATTDEQERLFEEAEGGWVFRRVMDLPVKYRTVIALYYFEDMSTKEIAQILKLTEPNVRVRLSRGKKLLKDIVCAQEVLA